PGRHHVPAGRPGARVPLVGRAQDAGMGARRLAFLRPPAGGAERRAARGLGRRRPERGAMNRLAAGALLAMGTAAAVMADTSAGAPPSTATQVFADRLWDDGKAEFSIYSGTTPRYGQARATEMRLIVVKEDLLRDALVKSDRGPVPGRTL